MNLRRRTLGDLDDAGRQARRAQINHIDPGPGGAIAPAGGRLGGTRTLTANARRSDWGTDRFPDTLARNLRIGVCG
jgi:hypothetical protein